MSTSGSSFRFTSGLVVAGLVAMVTAAGCSSTPAEAEDRSEDEVSFAASAATQREIGVVAWKASTNDDHVTKMRGVAKDGHVAAELGVRPVDHDGVRQVQVRFALGEDATTIHVEGAMLDGAPAIQALGSEVTEALGRGMELLSADLEAAEAPASAQRERFGLTTASLHVGGLHPQTPQLTDECAGGILHRCSAPSQALLCAKNALLDLPGCSIKGWKAPIELIQSIVTAGREGYTAACLQALTDVMEHCLALYPTGGNDQPFGNARCEEGMRCDSDPRPPPPPCPNAEGTVCRQGCNREGETCITDHGVPCASDAERRTWCCNGDGDPSTNECRSTCQGKNPPGGGSPTGHGQACCSGLVANGDLDCVSSCESAGGSCAGFEDCCEGFKCEGFDVIQLVKGTCVAR